MTIGTGIQASSGMHRLFAPTAVAALTIARLAVALTPISARERSNDPAQPLTTPQLPFRMHSETHFGRMLEKSETSLTHCTRDVFFGYGGRI